MSLSITSVKTTEQRRLCRTRVYVDMKDHTVLDSLIERMEGTEPPHEEYRKVLADAFIESKITKERKYAEILAQRATWSIHAGCRQCPCSPGFVLPQSFGVDIFVKVDRNG